MTMYEPTIGYDDQFKSGGSEQKEPVAQELPADAYSNCLEGALKAVAAF